MHLPKLPFQFVLLLVAEIGAALMSPGAIFPALAVVLTWRLSGAGLARDGQEDRVVALGTIVAFSTNGKRG